MSFEDSARQLAKDFEIDDYDGYIVAYLAAEVAECMADVCPWGCAKGHPPFEDDAPDGSGDYWVHVGDNGRLLVCGGGTTLARLDTADREAVAAALKGRNHGEYV